MWLARWDADTYLKKSFSRLHSSLKPDLLVFLGDTFSNGFEATDQQWDDYLQVQQLLVVYIIITKSQINLMFVCTAHAAKVYLLSTPEVMWSIMASFMDKYKYAWDFYM